ncbi:MAG: trk/ktr system potassium uptake protein [Kosmotogales bacterium]|nr:trk/ktr system potassium uptake protein [Kosmotogales bacterium]
MYIQVLKKRYKIVFSYIGTLFMFFSIVLLIPCVFCVMYPGDLNSSLSFIYTAILSFLFGFILSIWTKLKPGTPVTIQEGSLIVLFVWIFGIFFSSLPFVFEGILSFSHAFFESTSGWTTTGLTLVDVTKIPRIFLVWRSIMQFIGGAGFAIVMMSAILGPTGFGLYNAEGRMDNLVPNMRSSVRKILVIYFTYAIVGMLFYMIAGMSFFDAFNHSLTALATGGFSTRAGSIGEFNSIFIEVITMVLMILGTTGFGIHYLLWKRDWKSLKKNGEPKSLFFILIIFIPMIMFGTMHLFYANLGENFRHSIFQAVSALTGTGFSTVDFFNWNSFGLFMITLLMIFGGDLDSTSGGLKQYRIYIVYKLLKQQIINFFLPSRSVTKIEVWKGSKKSYVNPSMIREILMNFSAYFLTFSIGVGIISSYGFSLQDAAFEFASALSTVGLSIGITSQSAPLGIIWTETLGMFFGRLEFFVILYGIVKIVKDISRIREK